MNLKRILIFFALMFYALQSYAADQAYVYKAANFLKEYSAAARNYFSTNDEWPSSIATLKSQMPSQTTVASEYKFSPTMTTISGGFLKFTLPVTNAVTAKAVAAQVGMANTYQSGSNVILYVNKPMGTALRELYSDQVDTSNTTAFTILDSASSDGKSIYGIDKTSATTVSSTSGCVAIGSNSVCEASDGSLKVSASTMSLTGSLTSNDEVTAGIVDVVSNLKTGSLTAEDFKASTASIDNLVSDAATLTQADIDVIESVTANMTTMVSNTLKSTGLTTLASVVADSGQLSTITGTDMTVNGTAIVSALKANNIEVESADISEGTVTELVAGVANLNNLVSTLLDTRELLAETGVLGSLSSTTGTIDTLTSKTATIDTTNTTNLNATTAKLGALTIKTLLTAGELDGVTVDADGAVIGVLKATTLNSTTVNADSANVSGTLKTAKLVATTGTVSGDASATSMTASSMEVDAGLAVGNVLTTLKLAVSNDAVFKQLLKSAGLTVSNSSTFSGALTISGALTSSGSMTVSGTVTGNALNANSATLTKYIKSATLTANSASVSSALDAGQLSTSSATIPTLTATTLTASNKVTTANLVAAGTATLYKATINNLVATTSALGTITGSSLTVSGNANANTASMSSYTANTGNYGTLNVTGNGTVSGGLSVGSTLTAPNVKLTGKVTAGKSSFGTLKVSSLTSSSDISGKAVKTTSGVDLDAVKTEYTNQDGRISDIEAFKAECKANWTYACAATYPAIASTSCASCSKSSSSSGSFSATYSATISDCPSGCSYTWTTGSGLTKSSCSNGSVSAGASKTVSCTFKNSSTLSAGSKLSSSVTLTAIHALKSSITTSATKSVSWSYTASAPSVSVACSSGCSQKMTTSTFTGTAIGTISGCTSGCTYSWTLTNASADGSSCASGTVAAGATPSVSCRVVSDSVATGNTLTGVAKLTVVNSADTSLKTSASTSFSWTHMEDEVVALTYTCSPKCERDVTFTSTKSRDIVTKVYLYGGCKSTDTCSYSLSYATTKNTSHVPTVSGYSSSDGYATLTWTSGCKANMELETYWNHEGVLTVTSSGDKSVDIDIMTELLCNTAR